MITGLGLVEYTRIDTSLMRLIRVSEPIWENIPWKTEGIKT